MNAWIHKTLGEIYDKGKHIKNEKADVVRLDISKRVLYFYKYNTRFSAM